MIASPSHRQNCTRNLIINESVSARLKADPSLRLLLFSALEAALPPHARTDITFPAQIEVRLNGDEVRANYKGLKNKPGSTRPAVFCDTDHDTDYAAGGPSSEANLSAKNRRGHNHKTHRRWKSER